ncbi:NfeD family protein [Dysosmobacter sp.]
MIWLWLGAIVLFSVVEAVTAGLVSIWFVAGAAAALLAALAGISVTAQLVLFVAVSAVALAATRPLVRKLTAGKAQPTNADRVLGQTARVTETIDNQNADGKTWTARSTDGAVIPAGTQVRVTKIEGVKLFVEKIKVTEGTI